MDIASALMTDGGRLVNSEAMPWEDLITPFGDVLYARMKERGLTVRSFAELAGISKTFLSQVANRIAPPPLDRMEEWADILGLTGESRDYFLDLATLEVIPARAKRLFEPDRPGFHAIQSAISADRELALLPAAEREQELLRLKRASAAAIGSMQPFLQSRSVAPRRAAEEAAEYDRKNGKRKGGAKP